MKHRISATADKHCLVQPERAWESGESVPGSLAVPQLAVSSVGPQSRSGARAHLGEGQGMLRRPLPRRLRGRHPGALHEVEVHMRCHPGPRAIAALQHLQVAQHPAARMPRFQCGLK